MLTNDHFSMDNGKSKQKTEYFYYLLLNQEVLPLLEIRNHMIFNNIFLNEQTFNKVSKYMCQTILLVI